MTRDDPRVPACSAWPSCSEQHVSQKNLLSPRSGSDDEKLRMQAETDEFCSISSERSRNRSSRVVSAWAAQRGGRVAPRGGGGGPRGPPGGGGGWGGGTRGGEETRGDSRDEGGGAREEGSARLVAHTGGARGGA